MIPNSRPVTKNIAFGSEIPSSTKVADAYSDELMNDLFIDVDRILEGDLSRHTALVKHSSGRANSSRTVRLPSNFSPKSAADIYRATMAVANHDSDDRAHTIYGNAGDSQPVNLQSVNSQAIESQSAEVSQSAAQPLSNYLYPLEPPSESTSPNAAHAFSPITEPIIKPSGWRSRVSLPCLLMGAIGISAASVMSLWVLAQRMPSNGWPLSRQAAAAEMPAPSNEDFLVYLQRSLEVIRTNQEANQVVAALPSVQPSGQAVSAAPTTASPSTNLLPAMPTPGDSNSATGTPNPAEAESQPGILPNLPGMKAAQNIIERVFVPVYQNSQAAPSNPPNPSGNPSGNAANTANTQRPTVPVPGPAATTRPADTSTAAVPVVPATPQSQSDLPAPAVAVGPTNAAEAAVTDVTPTSEHVLVGILNLGSRSAALFNLDGNSQRAYVGDRVGLSGWTLVSVNGQNVVVRRDGEVRSIYIGQRF
ncbi:MAG: hypothetical protein WBD47_19490 [Phormidesmis sp.]